MNKLLVNYQKGFSFVEMGAEQLEYHFSLHFHASYSQHENP